MLRIICVLLLSSALMAQSSPNQTAVGSDNPQATANGPAQAAPQQPSGSGSPELGQMRDDLNKLESLNLNMSSEIEFLRDQNLQILLRTNVQMWRIVIRDLRRQVELEEQQRAVPPSQNPAPKTNPR